MVLLIWMSSFDTVYVVIFAVVLFLRISQVSRIFPLQYMSIYSNENNTKISHRKFPHLVQNHENICTWNIRRTQYHKLCSFVNIHYIFDMMGSFYLFSKPENIINSCWYIQELKEHAGNIRFFPSLVMMKQKSYKHKPVTHKLPCKLYVVAYKYTPLYLSIITKCVQATSKILYQKI